MLGNRLKTLLDALDLSQTAFSKEAGMSRTALNEVIRGRIKSLPPEILDFLSSKYEVNLNWLLTGRGEMFLVQQEELLAEELPSEPQPQSPETRLENIVNMLVENPELIGVTEGFLKGSVTIKEVVAEIERLPEKRRRIALIQIRALAEA